MASRRAATAAGRTLISSLRRQVVPGHASAFSSSAIRPFSTTFQARLPAEATTTTSSTAADNGAAASSPSSSTAEERRTHFGFETVTESEKTKRVAGVFTSVADSYDRMNDLMSFGIHRLWKDHFVSSLSPGLATFGAPSQQPQHILDVAGGTGDIAFRLLHTAHVVNGNPGVRVTISDINPAMLAVGRHRADEQLPAGQREALSFLEADATDFSRTPSGHAILDASVDLYTVAFGIRNFTDIPAALREAYRALKPGGVFACLEFAKVVVPDGAGPSSLPAPLASLLDAAYQRWSFGAIPLIGQLVAGDRDSYQYLVESIERFPSQPQFRDMIRDAGFVVGGGKGWEDLTGGIAAIHKGMKPLDA